VSAAILDGKAIAQEIRGEVAQQAAEFAAANNGKKPCLATVLVGEDPASQVYIRMKHKACEKEGLDSRHHVLPDDATEEQLLKQIAELNADDSVNGILVQLPVPDQINEKKVLDAIDPLKDVDAFHPENVGRIVQGRPRFLPCTPYGIQQMLHRKGIEVSGKHVVVIGRSEIVGKPMAMMLMQRGSELGRESANGTVTVCHSRTADLPGVCRQADIPDRGDRRGEIRHGRYGQTGRGGDRRRHQPHGRRPGGRRRFRHRQGSCRAHHARPRRRRPADHRHAAAQHADRRALAGRVTESTTPYRLGRVVTL
jgi:methylenetetrahydrofolate dehydrogenase (NADP+)/methenyltetrahydrofolate cyclohydrolase